MSYTVGESYAGLSAQDYATILEAAQGNDTLTQFLEDSFREEEGFYVYLGDDSMALMQTLEDFGYEGMVTYYTFLGSNWEITGF